MKKTSGKSQGRGDYLSLAIVISLLIGLILSSCARILELQELDKTKENSKNAQRGYSAGRFGSDNLVSNPSFESDLSGWEGWQSSLTRIALADAPDGDYVVRVTRTTGTSYTVDDNPATVDATVAGQTYWASAWVKAASTSSQGKSVTLRLREINSSGVLVKETISQAIPLATTFRQLFITAMAVASGNTLDIRISQSNAASGDSFYADQFILEPAPANNLVSNPSFETNTSGWIGWQSTLARTQLQGVDGDYVVKVTRSTGSSYTVNDEPPTVSSTTAGQTYDASAWVQAASTSAEGKTVTLKIREKNSAGELVQEISSPAIPLSNFFQQLSASITAQGNGNTIDIRISQTSAVSGDAFYADLFVVTAGDFVPPPGPGNLISNPSFETSLAGWIGWQAVLARESLGDAPDGNYAVKVSHSTGTSFTVNDQPANVSSTTAGQEYIASAWVKAASSSSVGKVVTLKLRERNSSNVTVQEWTSAPLNLTNSFQKLSVSGYAINNGDSLDVRISHGGAASGDAFYADLFELKLGDTAPPPPATDAPEVRPFDPDHPVYHPIPPNCPLYEYSSLIVANIAANYTKISIDDQGETPPIYVGQPSDPIWRVTIAGKQFNVHAPSNMSPGTGDDYPLIILDRASPDYNGHPVEYRMWRAVLNKNTNPWTITNQGGGVGVYANDGRILDDIQTQSGLVPRALGQAEIYGQNTGSGCSYTVGMIRPIDIQRGRIDHAVRVAIGYPHPTRWFWPALRTETWNQPPNNNMAPMGARIFIDHSVDIVALQNAVAARLSDPKNKAFAKMLVKAMQEYGFIALDGASKNNVYLEGRNTADWVSLIGPRNAWGTYDDIGRAIEAELDYTKLRVAHPSVFDNYAR
jgi:hypothetical protein